LTGLLSGMEKEIFLTVNSFLRQEFGQRVQKIPLDAGFTCPNRDGTKGMGGCIYCDDKGSGTGKGQEHISIREQMLSGIEWAKKRYKTNKYIAYFQSFSNTYHSDIFFLKNTFEQAFVSDDVVGLSIGTRPDCISKECLQMLYDISKGRLLFLELGLQSASDETLKKINRCHTLDEFINAANLVKFFGFHLCVHIIFGLPGEDIEKMKNTVIFLRDYHIDGIKFHNLYIHKDTIIEKYYRRGLYAPISQEDYTELVAWSVKELGMNVIIHRLTGDPRPDRLVAPSWALDKKNTVLLIKEKIKKIIV